MVVTLTKDNFEKEVEQSSKPVVIDVSATWCGPCQQMKPIFEQTAQAMGESYKFAELNVDDARDIAIKYGVTSVPTFIFIKDGEIKGKERGFMPQEDLKKKIQEYLD
jgi:thioredoxin 1